MIKGKTILTVIRTSELVLAGILAYSFRLLVDWLLAPLPLGQWIMLIRWILLIFFIGLAIRLHPLLVNFLKKKEILPQDFTW